MTRANFAPRTALIKQVHVARRQLGLDEADYRATLHAATGKDSSAVMTEKELALAVDAFERLGFKRIFKGAPDGKKSARPGIRLIFGLWTELGRRGLVEHSDRKALCAFVKRMTDVDHPDWLDNAEANKVIEALKAIRDRAKSKAEG